MKSEKGGTEMARLCDKIISEILAAENVNYLPDSIMSHIEGCEECAAEYKKIVEMQNLLQNAVPETPDIAGAVMSRLADETIAPAPRKKNSFRMATLAAAAAALAVYVSVYGTGLMDSFVGKDASEEILISDAENGAAGMPQKANLIADMASPEAAEEESYNAQSTSLKKAPTGGAGSSQGDGAVAEVEECKNFALYNDCVDDLKESTRIISEELLSRITDEQIEEVGREIYDLFVESITDFESEYTYEKLLLFAEEYK